MTATIDPADVYHVLRAVLEELPPGRATLEREPEYGRCQLIPARQGAARIYALGDISDCEIGIVEVTHSHFHDWDEAIAFCRALIRGEVEYIVWRDGEQVVRAQHYYEPSSDGGTVIDVHEALFIKPLSELRQERVKFEPY